MSQYFIDKLTYNNDTLDIHDTEAREMINANTTNIQAVSARVTKNANDINTLKDTTGVIREDLDNVEDRVSVTEAEIDGLKTRTTSLEGKMVTVENRLDGHDTKISGLESRMDTAENNITALDGRMTTAENDIDAAEHRLDLVEAKNSEQDTAIDNLETNVSKNTADIVDIKADLTGIHTDINDLDDRITASTYEAGIGIYFGQGAEHTNINVEDEILNQINQNTIDIQNLKTRVTNVENRLTVVEGDITNIKADITDIKGDITNIKAEIVNIKTDITALTVRVTALEQKVLPAGGLTGQMLVKKSNTNYDVGWVDTPNIKQRRWTSSNISEYTDPEGEGVWTDYFDKSCFTVSGSHLNAVPFCNTTAADKNLNWVIRTNTITGVGWDKTAYGFGGDVKAAGKTTGVETAIMFSCRELVTSSYTQWNYVAGGILIGIMSAAKKKITMFDTHGFIKTILAPDTSAGRYSNISKPGSTLKLYYYITVSGMTAYELGEILVTAFGVNANKLIGNTTTVDYDNNAYFVKLVMEYVNDAVTNTITTVKLGALA